MNHDISHCRGKNCPIKDTCHRFIASNDPNLGVWRSLGHVEYCSETECISGNMSFYWEEKSHGGDTYE